MGVVPKTKAGVGSAVNDAMRLLGGTLGVAVIGSVYASVYGSRLTAATPAGVPGQVAALAHQSVGAAYAAAGAVGGGGHPALGQALHLAATDAFLRGLTIGALVAGGVAAAGAILAALFLPAQPGQAALPAPAAPGHPVPSADPGQPGQPGQPARPGRAPGVLPAAGPARPDAAR
jgi:hypothetical protein